jgi:ribose transport system permease protein
MDNSVNTDISKTVMEDTQKKRKSNIANFIRLFLFIAVCIFFIFASENFLTKANIINIVMQVSITGILAIGMTYVIITGGIDLSVGSVVAISGITAAFLARAGYGLVTPILAAVAVSVLIGGVINGLLIAKCNLQPFIVTLATMEIARGMAMILTNAADVYSLDPRFIAPLSMKIMDIPFPAICFVVLFLIALFFEKRVPLSRYIYAIGDNEKSAALAGLPVVKTKIFVYLMSGVFAAISAVLLTARIAAAEPNMGEGYEMTAIGAIVIGGTSLKGGKGSVAGTLFGVFLFGILTNGMNLLNIPSFYQTVVKGVVIIFAVLLDKLRK